MGQKRSTGPLLRFAAPVALVLFVLLVAAGELGIGTKNAYAVIGENDVAFTVTQSPGAPVVLHQGTAMSFAVTANSTVNSAYSLVFDFDYPSGLVYSGASSVPSGIVCTDNTPSAGIVRCDYGPVTVGALATVTLNFTVSAASTTSAGQALMRAGPLDPTGDLGSNGDDSFVGAGVITIFDAPTNITLGDNFNPPGGIFEGGSATYTVTLTNTTGTATNGFTVAVGLTNGIVTGVTCTASAGTHGVAAGTGSAIATCTGSAINGGNATLTVTVSLLATNLASNGAVTPDVTSAGIVLGSGEFAEAALPVSEAGLQNSGGGTMLGDTVNVCTAAVGADSANTAAAGSAQPNNPSLVGSPSGNALLQTGDFTVSGPAAGAVIAATGCGGNQSGVRFTPTVAGVYTVTANYNVGGANSLPVTINNPAPTTSSISPSSTTAPGLAFTLTVNGTNFVNGSVVRWNGSDRPTTFVNSAQLTAAIPAGDVSAAGVVVVTVFNPSPGGGISGGQAFAVNASSNPVPTLSSLSPTNAAAGSAGFTLTVTGTGYVNGITQVRWNGGAKTTACSSATQCTASIAAGDIAAAGARTVDVFNPAPGGGTSTALTFNVDAASNPVPAATSLTPSSGTVGGGAFTLTVNGSSFVGNSVVRVGGLDRATTYVSATQLRIGITAGDLATAGTLAIEVFNPLPGGGTSANLSLPVNNPAPTASALSPASANAGSAGFTLTVTGTNFISGSIVRWGGADRTTTYVSATQLTASIPGTDVASAGSGSVTVFNPTPGGGTSGTQTFTINAAGASPSPSPSPSPGTSPSPSASPSATPTPGGTPTASTELVAHLPGGPVPRSRLQFTATDGSLSPSAVTFVIKRKSDNKYWNGISGQWQVDLYENAGTQGDTGTWKYGPAGNARRSFANTVVIMEARAVQSGQPYRSASAVEITVR